jgi:hypothetical protein
MMRSTFQALVCLKGNGSDLRISGKTNTKRDAWNKGLISRIVRPKPSCLLLKPVGHEHFVGDSVITVINVVSIKSFE